MKKSIFFNLDERKLWTGLFPEIGIKNMYLYIPLESEKYYKSIVSKIEKVIKIKNCIILKMAKNIIH